MKRIGNIMKKNRLVGLLMATVIIATVFAPFGASASCPCDDPQQKPIYGFLPPITIGHIINLPHFWVSSEKLNDDDLYDVVVSRYSENVIDVYFGVDENNFTEPTSYSANRPRGTAVFYADMFDEYIDLAVANYGSRSITILLNDGTGTFQINQEIQLNYRPVYITYYPTKLWPNLVIWDLFKNPRTMLLNNFDGTFYPIPFNGKYNPGKGALACGPEPDCDPTAGEGIQECMRAANCRFEKCAWACCVLYNDGQWGWLRYHAGGMACAAVHMLELAACIPLH